MIPIRLGPNISGDYIAGDYIANYSTVCCEAAQSAILATACLVD